MTNREKMLQHLAQAEEAQAKVDDFEKRGRQQALRKYGHRIANAQVGEEREAVTRFYTKEVLKKNENYMAASNAVRSHLDWAQVYGLAALNEEAKDSRPRPWPGSIVQ